MSASRRYSLIFVIAAVLLIHGMTIVPESAIWGKGHSDEAGIQKGPDSLLSGKLASTPTLTVDSNPPSLFKDEIPNHIRREILDISVGWLLMLLGIVLMLIAIWRWRSDDYTLVSFGVLCFLYGARTSFLLFLLDLNLEFWEYWAPFVTYLVPLAAWIFTEQLLGKGWKSSIRLVIYAQALFSLIAIILGLVLKSPWVAMPANNFAVIIAFLVLIPNIFFLPGKQTRHESLVLRFGFLVLVGFALHANLADIEFKYFDLGQGWEPIGFIVFIASLGYIVIRRFLRFEKDLATISQEMETARQIQSFILPQDQLDLKHLDIAARYEPMTAVAGDFYDFTIIDDDRIGILVADVSGHGVPASLISAMVKIALAAQKPFADDPARVLKGLNNILCGKLESDFVTAAYCLIDTRNRIATYAGAGHPPLLTLNRKQNVIDEHLGKGIILGQLEDAEYQTVAFNLTPGDRIILYTDGLIEAANPVGELFGWKRFKAAISRNLDTTASVFADILLKDVSDWSGGKENQDDDLTLIVVDVKS